MLVDLMLTQPSSSKFVRRLVTCGNLWESMFCCKASISQRIKHLVTGASGAKSQGLTDPNGLVQNLEHCGTHLVPTDLVVMQTLVVRPTKDAQKVPAGNK